MSDPLTPEQRASLVALAEQATPGPWTQWECHAAEERIDYLRCRAETAESTMHSLAEEGAAWKGRAVAAEALADSLAHAINKAGFSVMKASNGYSIHDVSEKAKEDDKRTDKVICENIDLERQVKAAEERIAALEAALKAISDARIDCREDGGAGMETWFGFASRLQRIAAEVLRKDAVAPAKCPVCHLAIYDDAAKAGYCADHEPSQKSPV